MKLAARYFIVFLWLVLFMGCQPEAPLPFVDVFVTADIEGVFWAHPEPRYGNEMTGGLAVLKNYLDKQTNPFLLLEGGNWFAQTPEGALSQGDYFNTLAASLPYAGRLFTEKDLVYGWPSLSRIIKQSSAPFVLSNVKQSNGRMPNGMVPWLLEKVGDYKIGVFGLINPHGLEHQQRLSGLTVTDPIEAARQTVQALREEGAQVIILLSGLKSAEEEDRAADIALAEEINGIDIIIRSNLDREQAESSRLGDTLWVYPGAHLNSVARIRLFFGKNGEVADIQLEEIGLSQQRFGENELIAREIETLRRTARNQMTHPVGKSEQELVGKLDKESSLGDWAADCLRKWAKADAAVINSSSLRAPLPKGQITQYDLYTLYPYNDNVTYLTIKGDALLKALEEGLSVPDNFAQVSGLRIAYKPGAPAGKRIVSASINGTPIAKNSTYRVAVTDHMLAGGAGHDGFIDSLEFKNTQVEMRTVLRLCLAGKKPVTPPEGKRWRVNK